MNLKKIITSCIAFIALGGIGIFAHANNANASDPAGAVRYLNNRDNYCYYGHYYDQGLKQYFRKGLLPRAYRHYGKMIFIVNPDDPTGQPRIHGHKSYYNVYGKNIFINKKDFGPYKYKNKLLIRKSRSSLKRNNREIKRLKKENQTYQQVLLFYNSNKDFHFTE